MKFSEYAIKKPVTSVMIALSVIVLGFISLSRLPLEYMPNVDYPSMWVIANYPSSSPEEIDREIIRPLEGALATLSGLKGIFTRSYDYRGWVGMDFKQNTDLIWRQSRSGTVLTRYELVYRMIWMI